MRKQANGGLGAVDQWNRMLALTSLAGPRGGYLLGPSIHPNMPMLPTRYWRPEVPPNCQLPRKQLVECVRLRSEILTATLNLWERRVLEGVLPKAALLTGGADSTPQIAKNSVSLIVTGPPGLKPYDYCRDNWLGCWFVGLDPESVPVSVHAELDTWQQETTGVFVELYRVLT